MKQESLWVTRMSHFSALTSSAVFQCIIYWMCPISFSKFIPYSKLNIMSTDNYTDQECAGPSGGVKLLPKTEGIFKHTYRWTTVVWYRYPVSSTLLWWDSLSKVQPMPASAIMMCSKILTPQGSGSWSPHLWLLRQSANKRMNHDKQLGTSKTLLMIGSEMCLTCCVTDCYGFRVFALQAGEERFYVC